MRVQTYAVLALAGIILLFSITVAGCTARAQVASSPPDTMSESAGDNAAHPAAAVPEPVEEPRNPNGDPEIAYKSLMIRAIIPKASSFYWELIVNGGGPDSYETLIETGTLPIIFANRYTGEDIRNIKDYSPGDFYLHFPTTDEPVYSFWDHYGEKDYGYDPAAIVPGERHPLKGMGDYTTDGRTLFLDVNVSEEDLTVSSLTSGCRERYDIAPEDEAGARMLVVYDAMDEIMRSAADWISDLPVSLDGYIELVGRPNPVAWSNPYAGGQMHEVPWVKVPCYQQGVPFMEPIPDPGEYGDNADFASLPGNYSFAFDSERDYTQFYFKQADGSVGAYLVIVNRQ